MAITLTAKAPGDALRYTWVPALVAGDSLASATLAVTGGTVVLEDYEISGSEVAFFVSSGAAGETATIAATATTTEDEDLTETIYLPVIATGSQIANTARDYCTFALRKVVGNGETPDATELDDALEQLNGMVAQWREGGADVGATFPIEANTVIYCPDWAADAIRYNLRLQVYSLYGEEPTAMDALKAKQGLQLVKHKNLPDEREGADYY